MPGSVVLESWNLNLLTVLIIAGVGFVYVRGWFRANAPVERLAAFLAGLLVLFIALESPLDTFGTLFLSVHMTQHVLLMMAAPLLIMLGRPWTMLLRGLPPDFVREGLGPFLKWRPVQKLSRWIVSPAVTWLIYAAALIFWHLPRLYQLALASPLWHDAQHACFFWSGVLFWSPVINRSSRMPQWFAIPYLLLADILNTAFSAILVFSGRVFYPAYESVRIGAMPASTDQVIAGAVMWVPGSLFFLVPVIGIAYKLAASPSRLRISPRRPAHRRQWLDLDLRPLRRFARPLMLIAAIAIIAEGFAGSDGAAAATWFYWRALAVIVVLAIGNLFCMACPLTLARDAARRFFPPHRSWPVRLRNKWIATVLFVAYLWAYTEFSLWNRPIATAWIIIGYFIAIVSIDCVFTGAAFCKYVCPVGQFNFVLSAISPAEIGVRDRAVCSTCRTHDCARGNEKSRGCQLGLFPPAKAGNLDCTFCLDCVTACPSSNAGLVPLSRLSTLASDAPPSAGRISRRNDLAALAAIFTFGAFVNACQMLDLTTFWRLLSIFGPAAAVALCFGANSVVVPAGGATEVLRRSIFALTPIGAAMWLAHLLYHAAPPALSLTSLRDLQIVALDAGVLMSVAAIWKITGRIGLALPWQIFSLLLYSAGVWIVFQPMRMAGMSM